MEMKVDFGYGNGDRESCIDDGEKGGDLEFGKDGGDGKDNDGEKGVEGNGNFWSYSEEDVKGTEEVREEATETVKNLKTATYRAGGPVTLEISVKEVGRVAEMETPGNRDKYAVEIVITEVLRLKEI